MKNKKLSYLLTIFIFTLAITMCKYNKSKAGDEKFIISMIKVEPGSFNMGSNESTDEKPIHKVNITKGFYMSKYQITANEASSVLNYGLENKILHTSKSNVGYFIMYEKTIIAFLYPGYLFSQINFNGSKIVPLNGKEQDPVVGLNWYGAVIFCNLLSEINGKQKVYNLKTWKANFNKNGYRLPTEAEWEFAAKGGNKSKNFIYSGSNNIDEVAWYRQMHTHPVGLKKPNELGFYDMSGNLYEWCNDWYSENYYSYSQENDPRGPESGKYHVRRSCVWSQNEFHNRISDRIHGAPFCTSICGIRIVRKY